MRNEPEPTIRLFPAGYTNRLGEVVFCLLLLIVGFALAIGRVCMWLVGRSKNDDESRESAPFYPEDCWPAEDDI